jgi:hypothetical protein
MPGRKMKTEALLVAIFLPDIFLLSMVCLAGEPSFAGLLQSRLRSLLLT